MSNKRGRPLSGESNNPRIERRREMDRARQRRRRERQGEAGGRSQISSSQYDQIERVITLPSVAEEEAAQTLLSLGMRKSSGLEIPHDSADAHLQEAAEDIDEHDLLYPTMQRSEQNASIQQKPVVEGFFRQFTTPKRQSLGQRSRDKDSPATNSSVQINVSNSHHSSPILHWEHDDGAICTGYETEAEEATNDIEETGRADIQRHVTAPSLGSEDALGLEQLQHGSDDEESHVSFASEREVDEEEEIAVEYAAEKLFEQLQGGHHGCSEEDHADKLREHMNKEGNNHYRLSDLFRNRRLPSVLGSDNFVTATELEQQHLPTAAEWEAAFCGVPANGEQRSPMNVCLHKEPTQEAIPEVVFDADSFLAFLPSLAAAKCGLSYQPAPQTQQNIQTDIHLEMNAFSSYPGDDEVTWARKKLLRDVPHCLLGRIAGAHNITVHVLFPHIQLVGETERFISLTEQQLTRWTDEVFHPALWRVLPAHYTQHLPPTYQVALANSKANQVEARKVDSSSYQAQQAITYHLQSEYLYEIWEAVVDIVNHTPGLADFREPQLFFTAKGTKLAFKGLSSRPTLLDVMESFESYFNTIFDMRYVDHDRLYVDIGKEICPGVSLLPGQQLHVGEEAQVYLWKRCCLEEYMQWMYEGKPPTIKSQGQRYYHQNMLYDASSVTSVTPKESKLRKGGLIYTQLYSSVKEFTDAVRCKLFDNDGLEEMALDPGLRRGARNVAGGHRREVQIIESAYKASKRRARAAIRDSMRRSTGVREEHRITWKLFQALKGLLEAQDRESLDIALTDCPSYVWPVRTSTYLNFLWRSADKFATGFEIVRAQARADMVTWEQTKMMFAFLRCLRFVMGGHRLEPESAMWCSRRTLRSETQQRDWYGLGFCNTLLRYKYCWMEPRVDWERLCFKSSVTNRMLFGNGVLRGQVLRRGTQVTAFFDTALALERGLKWLEANRGNEVIEEEVLSWMVHICLKQFRVDVLTAVRAEIREEHRECALRGEVGFSYEYFEEIMTQGCYLMSGNRCDFKAPQELAGYLLGQEDGRSRQYWEDKPFRKLYQRVRAGLGGQGGELRATFTRRYWRWLFAWHWILPYPCGNALLQTSKGGGKRMWYSIRWEEEGQRWRWGRKEHEAGRPRGLAQNIRWGEEEWKRWMEERGGVEADSEAE